MTARPRQTVRRRRLVAAGILLSLTIAAYGQHIIDNRGTLGDGWPLLSAFDGKLTELYGVEQSVAYAIPLLALAMLLFALSQRWLGHEAEGRDSTPLVSKETAGGGPAPAKWIRPALGAGALIALTGWLYLIVRLIQGSYDASYVGLFFGVLIVTAGGLLVVDRRNGMRWRVAHAWKPWEFALVLLVTGLFLGLVLPDLTNWRYAGLTDDAEFFYLARRIAYGATSLNLFSQQGAFGDHPLMGSAYQAAVMRVAGINTFGWKLSSVLVIAASVPFFYWLLRTLFDSWAAAFGTIIFGVSHYLLGYAHTGYENLQPIFPTIVAFALFFAGKRNGSAFLLFASGAMAGLGFYTVYSSRAIVLLLGLAVAALGRRGWRRELLLPLLAGFVLAVTPVVSVNGCDVVTATHGRSAAEGRTITETIWRLAESAPRATLAFNFNPYAKHFVSGSLLDEISAVLALLGLGYAASRFSSEGHRFLVLWFAVAMVIAGLFHPRQEEINSRLHYALPAAAALAGLALDRTVVGLAAAFASARLEALLRIGCLIVVMPAILGFNVQRHWVVTPAQLPATPAALVWREATAPLCDKAGRVIVVATQDGVTAFSITAVFDSYERTTPLVLWPEVPAETSQRALAALRDGTASCLLVTRPQPRDRNAIIAWAAGLAARPPTSVTEATDNSGETHLLVLRFASTGPD